MPSNAESGLQPNEERPHTLFVSPIENVSWPVGDKNISYTIPPGTWWPWCDYWKDPQHTLYQLANFCFVLAYSSTCSKRGVLLMHSCLILGLMLFSIWAWNVICAPDVFTWNFAFMLMNLAQVFHILYQLRPVKFDPELEEAYHTLFEPFKLTRLQFKRMVNADFAQIMSLHAGEAYAVQNLTRTDRLGLLLCGKIQLLTHVTRLKKSKIIMWEPVKKKSNSNSNCVTHFGELKNNKTLRNIPRYVIADDNVPKKISKAFLKGVNRTLEGPTRPNYMNLGMEKTMETGNLLKNILVRFKVNVLSDNQFLHPILPCEFLDSPEFESSRNTVDDKFKVSIVACSTCRYLYWQRSSLEYLFVKDNYIATVLTTIIARDIATKLYAMNNKIVTAKGSHLDIRLPSITSSLTFGGEYKSPIRTKKANGGIGFSPEMFANENRHKFRENGNPSQHCYVSEMEPLTELPSTDDLTSNDVESWLETSSKYHSCEIVDMD